MAGGRRGGIRGEVLASGIMRALQSRLAQLVVLLTLTLALSVRFGKTGGRWSLLSCQSSTQYREGRSRGFV